MQDRIRKMADRKPAVFDRAKSFLCRIQKLSYVRSKIRLFIFCWVSRMPAVRTTRNINTVLTQLRLELFRVQLVYNCTAWMSTQSIFICYSTGVATMLCIVLPVLPAVRV